MFENRLIFTDKLVLDGRRHHALRPAPRDRHRAPRACAASASSRPTSAPGMAMLIAALCADGRSEIGNIRQIDRGYERIDERLRDLGARIERVATEPQPVAAQVVIHPHPERHARRAARRDARAARDHGRPARRLRAARLRRGLHAGDRVRVRCSRRADGGPQPAYRVFDDHGEVAGPARGHDGADRARRRPPATRRPSRRCASATSPTPTGPVRPHRGQMREFLQAGIELVGAPGPAGTAEALTVLCHALDAVGLDGYRVGLGDAALYPALLDGLGVAGGGPRRGCSTSSATQDFVGARARGPRASTSPPATPSCSCASRSCAAGPSVLERAAGPGRRRRCAACATSSTCSTPAVAERVIFDLGLARGLGYYTGAVFDVYDPGARRAARRRRALRRPARALRARPAGRRLRPRRRPPARSRWPGRRR